MNTIIILIIVFIIFIFYTIILKNNFKNKIKKITEQLTEELKFKSKIDEDKYNKELEEKKIQIQKEYEIFCKNIAEKRKLNESLLEEDKKHSFDKIMLYEELEREKSNKRLEEEYNIKKQELINEFESFIDNLNNIKQNNIDNFEKERKNQQEQIKIFYSKIEEIRLQLLELEHKRNVTIESWKREEEIKNKIDFYRIVLSEKDKEDIEILNSIRNKLNNKDSLNRLLYDVFIKKPMNDMLLRVVGANSYSGIYKITHINSQKCYIGKSVDIKKRLIEHCKGAYGISTIADQSIHKAMSEIGIDQFTFEVLEKVPKDKLSEKEKYWIKYYNSIEYGWNDKIG